MQQGDTDEEEGSTSSYDILDDEIVCAKNYFQEVLARVREKQANQVYESGEITISELDMARKYIKDVCEHANMKDKEKEKEEESNKEDCDEEEEEAEAEGEGEGEEEVEGEGEVEGEESENESNNEEKNSVSNKPSKENVPPATALAISSPLSNKEENLKGSNKNSSKEESKSSILYDKKIKQNIQNYISNQTEANSKLGFKNKSPGNSTKNANKHYINIQIKPNKAEKPKHAAPALNIKKRKVKAIKLIHNSNNKVEAVNTHSKINHTLPIANKTPNKLLNTLNKDSTKINFGHLGGGLDKGFYGNPKSAPQNVKSQSAAQKDKPASQSVPRGIKTSNQQRLNQTLNNEDSQTERLKSMRQKLMSHRSQNRSANRELPPIKHKPMTFSPPTRFFSDPRINKSQNEAETQPMIKRKARKINYIKQKKELMRKQFIINCFLQGNLSEEERKLIVIYSSNLF